MFIYNRSILLYKKKVRRNSKLLQNTNEFYFIY